MIRRYKVKGMTCQGCVATIKERLSSVEGVHEAILDLETGSVELTLVSQVSLTELKAVLPQKYEIEEGSSLKNSLKSERQVETPKWQQLTPLFLIFTYLFVASILLNFKDWSMRSAMLDFMGLFYIVFSFFKFLDLRGFPRSFSMYDPLARSIPIYGWIYPFLELALGLLFLMRIEIQIALVITVVILSITTGNIRECIYTKPLRIYRDTLKLGTCILKTHISGFVIGLAYDHMIACPKKQPCQAIQAHNGAPGNEYMRWVGINAPIFRKHLHNGLS